MVLPRITATAVAALWHGPTAWSRGARLLALQVAERALADADHHLKQGHAALQAIQALYRSEQRSAECEPPRGP